MATVPQPDPTNAPPAPTVPPSEIQPVPGDVDMPAPMNEPTPDAPGQMQAGL